MTAAASAASPQIKDPYAHIEADKRPLAKCCDERILQCLTKYFEFANIRVEKNGKFVGKATSDTDSEREFLAKLAAAYVEVKLIYTAPSEERVRLEQQFIHQVFSPYHAVAPSLLSAKMPNLMNNIQFELQADIYFFLVARNEIPKELFEVEINKAAASTTDKETKK